MFGWGGRVIETVVHVIGSMLYRENEWNLKRGRLLLYYILICAIRLWLFGGIGVQ